MKKRHSKKQIDQIVKLKSSGLSWDAISKKFKGLTSNAVRKLYYRTVQKPSVKVLILDIESAPIISHVWDIWEQNVALNQIQKDWHILSFSAKWLHSDEVIYKDQSNAKNIEDDKALLQEVWNLLDECDICLTHNGIRFDIPKLNARFIQCGFPPPSSFRNIDTNRISRNKFNFTSTKLEYLSDKLCKKYKKSKHKKFPGHELWTACLANNKEAWQEMKNYNELDVLALEELYFKLIPWDNSINFSIYTETLDHTCSCGNDNDFRHNGFVYTNTGKFKRLICNKCGKESKEKKNLLSKEKRKSLRG